MNKSYKVIFNKHRGIRMVVNELTSSASSKGTKKAVVTVAAVMAASVAQAGYFNQDVTLDKNTIVDTTLNSTTSHYAGFGVNQNSDGQSFIVDTKGFDLTIRNTAEGDNMYAGLSALTNHNNPSKPPKAGELTVKGNVKLNINTVSGSAFAIRNTGMSTITVDGDLSGVVASDKSYVMGIAIQKLATTTNLKGKTDLQVSSKNEKFGAYGLVTLGYGAPYDPNVDPVLDNTRSKTNIHDSFVMTVEGPKALGAQLGGSGEIHVMGPDSLLVAKGQGVAGIDITNATGLYEFTQGQHTVRSELVAGQANQKLFTNIGIANKGILNVGEGVESFHVDVVGVGNDNSEVNASTGTNLHAVGIVSDWYLDEAAQKLPDQTAYRSQINLLGKAATVSVSDGSINPGNGDVGGIDVNNGSLTTGAQTALAVDVTTQSTGTAFGIKLGEKAVGTLQGTTVVNLKTPQASQATGLIVGDTAQLTMGNATGTSTITVASAKPSVGIHVSDNGVLNLGGNTTITATNALTGKGTINQTAGQLDLTSSSLSKFEGTFNLQGGNVALNNTNGYFAGAVNVSGGTLDIQNLTAPTLSNTTLSSKGQITGTTGQFFANALNAEGNNTSTGAYKDTGLTIQGGTIAFTDAKYNIWYAGSATEQLEQKSTGDLTVIFNGTLVQAAHPGVVDTKPSNLLSVADANANYKAATHAVLSGVTLDASSVGNKLTIGQKGNNTTTLASNLGFKNVKVGSDTQSVDINGYRTLTLVGSKDGGNLFEGASKGLQVQVGSDGNLGQLHLGASKLDLNGTLNANVNVGTKGMLTVVDGKYDIDGRLNNGGQVTISGDNAQLSIADLINTGSINAGTGTLALTGTFDNTKGKIIAQNLNVANGSDLNIDGIKNLKILGAGTGGQGFTIEHVTNLDKLQVVKDGKVAINTALQAQQLDNAGNTQATKDLQIATLTNSGTLGVIGTANLTQLTNSGELNASILNVKDGTSKDGLIKAETLNVSGQFELGNRVNIANATVADGAILNAQTIDLSKLEVLGKGTFNADKLTSTDVTIESKASLTTKGVQIATLTNSGNVSVAGTAELTQLTNTGELNASILNVKDGTSKDGLIKAETLNVSGQFELGNRVNIANATVADGAILNAQTIDLSKLEVLGKGAFNADKLTVKSGYDNSTASKLGALHVQTGGTGYTLGQDRTIDDVTVDSNATLTTKGVQIATLTNSGKVSVAGTADLTQLTNMGELNATILNIKDGTSKDGHIEAETLNVSGQFELGNRVNIVNAKVADGAVLNAQTIDLSKLEVLGKGAFNADKLTVTDVTIDSNASLTTQTLDANVLKGEGTLIAQSVAFDDNDLSGFKGLAELNGGAYNLTDKNAVRWFGGQTKFNDKASLDVTQLKDAQTVLDKVTMAGGSMTAVSGQIFKTALSDTSYVDNPDAVLTKATFTNGTLTFVDGQYNVAYADKAGTLLKDMQLVFTGKLVSAPTPDVPPSIEQPQADLTTEDFNKLETPDNKLVFDAALNASNNDNKHDLIIGSANDVESTPNNAELINTNVGVSQIKLSDKAELVAVNNNRTLTLIGEGADQSLLSTNSQSVTLEVGGQQTAGVLALGVKSEAVANAGTLNVDTKIGAKGLVEVNAGEFTASKTVTNEGQLVVKNDAALNVAHSLDLKSGSSTTVDGRLETTTQSTVNVATGATLALNGNAVINKLAVNKTEGHNEALITVGNQDKAGKVFVKDLADANTSHLLFFLDPAWKKGDNTLSSTTSLVFEDATFAGQMIAAQNSYTVFGTTADEAALHKKFERAGLTWGPKATTAMAYVAHDIDLGTTGRIIVDGSYQSIEDVRKHPVDAKVNVSVAAHGVLMVNAKNDLITGTNPMNVVFDKNATMVLDNVKASDKAYTIFGADASLTHNDAKLLATNGFFDLAWTDTNGVIVKLNTQSNPYVGLMQGLDLASAAMNQPNSKAYTYTDNILSAYGTDRVAGAAAFDAAMNVAGAAATFTTAYDRASEFRDAVRGEAIAGEGNRLWAQVTGGKTKLKGISTGAQSLHVDTDAYGLVIGGDTVLNGYTVGAAFTAGKGDSENKAVGVKDDFDFYGLSVYGKTAVGGVDLVADASMTFLKSDLTMGGMADVNTDTDTTVYSMGVQAQKTFDFGVDVTPYVGLDLYHLRADGYSNGHGAQVDDANATALEIPVGATVSKAFDTASGFKVKPVFHFAIVPTVGDRDIDSKVRFASAQSTYNFTFADDVKVRTGLGLAAEKDNFRFGFNAGYDWGNEERAATKLMLNAQYLF